MKTNKLLAYLAFLPALCGCASFNSGDTLVDRGTARAMLEDRGLTPFSQVEVSWQNFPYRAPTESIGEGSSVPKPPKPRPSDPEDAAAFGRKAREIFAKAGLYDKARGRGTLRLELTTFGRWTYRDLFHSYMVDTPFIFIVPSSLRVNYYLTANFSVSSGTVRVETEARHKTTFHLLMLPLYPFFSPGARENGLLKQMLWRSATDVYERLKAAGTPARELPPKAAVPEAPAISVPPVQPDRTWLPGGTAAPAAALPEPPIAPEKPDQTWVVPAASQPPPAPLPQTLAPAPPRAAAGRTDTAAPAKALPEQSETPDD